MTRKRVLIVTSSFCPAMLPDMHRARMLCFDLPTVGWDVEILTADASYQRAGSSDADAATFFATDVPVHAIGPWLPQVFRSLRVGGIGWRAWMPMYRAGNKLLEGGRFDLIYFSTTQFPLMCLGPTWRAKHGIAYILDFQDPWYRPQPAYFTTERVFKARATNWLFKRMERLAVTRAGGLVSVSPQYVQELNTRYIASSGAWSQPSRQEVIPFAASPRDLECVARTLTLNQTRRDDGLLKFVYVGAGGITRATGFEALCRALAQLRTTNPQLVDRVRIGLYGTAGGASMTKGMLAQIAARYGLGAIVDEQTDLVSYFDSLRLASEADGLLILGVDHRGYTPSKLFNYLLFNKPVLACFQEGSPAEEFVLGHPEAAALIRFGGENATPPDRAVEIVREFLQSASDHLTIDRTAIVEEYLAPAMARRHAELFDRVIGRNERAAAADQRAAPVT